MLFINNNISVPNDNVRNFTIGSWIYTKNKYKYYARHIGSRDKLSIDIKLLKLSQYHNEVNNRECQLMHDLLIYMILNSFSLISNFYL